MSGVIDDPEATPPDEGRHYAIHVERAIANAERALAFATGDGAARNHPHIALAVVIARAMSAQTDALLAVADRLDVLIGNTFDEGRPVTVRDWSGRRRDDGPDDDDPTEGGAE